MFFNFFRKKSPTPAPDALDFIIVGQGLAGTLLALELEKRGRKVLVVDDGWKTAASQVAAGVLNPVTGMRIVKTLGADDLVPAAKRVYADLAVRFGKTFFRETPFYRFYTSEHERSVKAKREQDPDYAGWLSQDVSAYSLCGGGLADRLGGFFVERAGWLDIPSLLECARAEWVSRGALLEEKFEYADLEVSRSGAKWRGRELCGGVIFCEGFRVRENPWFGHLKWQPAKGEFIEIELAGTEVFQGQILKSSVAAIPLGGTRWRVGTNYDREQLDTQPTAEVAERLRRSFCNTFAPAKNPEEAKIVAHRAGVRPAVQGTLPKVGAHESHAKLFLFNGFGSKGVTWLPLYAERFAEKLAAGR
ncbi:MAG: FAD-binding oxidoreductase [Opitutales bacterium]|nr:FAD-binding oxidoreductase [Opitutales bacterium]